MVKLAFLHPNAFPPCHGSHPAAFGSERSTPADSTGDAVGPWVTQ